MNFRTIFGAVFAIIAFSFLIGMCKTCKAKQKEKEVTTEQPAVDENGKPIPGKSKDKTAGPGIIERIFGREKPVVQQTFEIWHEDESHETIFYKESLITPWSGKIIGPFRIVPGPGQVISIHLSGWYDEEQQWHDAPPPVIFRGGQTNPKLPMHGKGDIYIYAAQ